MIIAEPLERAARRGAWIVIALSLVVGTAAAIYFSRAGLTLSHYDARAHLVVSRRVIDSLTPGWRQLGAVWLPLPHLLNALPVQFDWSFRTGFSGVAISILALSGGLGALARYLIRHTGSMTVGGAAAIAALLNPNVLYLQSTPMTEPLLFGLALIALMVVDDWLADPTRPAAHRAGLTLGLLVLTRYEGWLIALALLALAAVSRPRGRGLGLLAVYPFVGTLAFFGLSYLSSGVLLVTSGFFTPDNPARGSLLRVIDQIREATGRLAGPVLMVSGLAGIVIVAVRAIRTRAPRVLLPLGLLATIVLPIGAFYQGHPERVRYMVPLVIAAATLGGLTFAAVPARLRAAAAVVWLGLVTYSLAPLAADAPMVTEAQWETPYRQGRTIVTDYLRTGYDGTPILASMGSLAHYMQESSGIGLRLRNFVHEGNGDLWLDALGAPGHHVRWVLIEGQAEGGDLLAARLKSDPRWLADFEKVVDGGGLSLYRRR